LKLPEAEDSIRSLSGDKTRRRAMRLFFILLLGLMVAPSVRDACAQQSDPTKTPARIALVIGNANYQDAESPLKEPITDARALADELRRAGFDLDTGENLSKDAMRRAFDRFYGKVKQGTVALVFFSGYGIQSNQQTYLIPVDAHIWTEADVRRDGISLDAVLAELGGRGATTKLAILDASRRNPFERHYRLTSAGLAPPGAARGNMVMYSTAPGNSTDDAMRGVFVSELIKQIRAPRLTVEEAFDRTRMEVSRTSQGQQVPWFMSLLTDDFSFDLQSAVVAANQSPTIPQAKLTRPEEGNPAAMPSPNPAPAEPLQTAVASPSRLNQPQDAKPRVQPEAKPAVVDAGKSPTDSAIAKLDSRPDTQAEAPKQSAAKSPQAPDQPANAASIGDPAMSSLDARLQRDPNDAVAYYKRGQLYAQNRDFSRAAADFDAAIRLNPTDVEALNNRCWARSMFADLQMALQDCNEALRLRPGYVDALDSRGLVYLKMNLTRSAIADYDAALQIKPNQASSLYGRGIGKLRMGRTVEGNKDIAAAKAINASIAEEFAGYGIR